MAHDSGLMSDSQSLGQMSVFELLDLRLGKAKEFWSVMKMDSRSARKLERPSERM